MIECQYSQAFSPLRHLFYATMGFTTSYCGPRPSSDIAYQHKQLTLKKMSNELGKGFKQYLDARLPRIKRSSLPKFKRRTVTQYSTNNMGTLISKNYDRLRVSTIGGTFLDMVRKVEYCGGMKSVIRIFEKQAMKHIEEIADEIEKHGRKIDKVRAGYILDERCKIKNDTVNAWIQNAQRGGSSKLDAKKPSKPTYSEKCIYLPGSTSLHAHGIPYRRIH